MNRIVDTKKFKRRWIVIAAVICGAFVGLIGGSIVGAFLGVFIEYIAPGATMPGATPVPFMVAGAIIFGRLASKSL